MNKNLKGSPPHLILREATIEDSEYIAQNIVDMSLHIKSTASDIYIDGLPGSVDDRVKDFASLYIGCHDSITYIYEVSGVRVGCIAAKIEDSAFSACGIGTVGNIAICWVAPEHRKNGIASSLVSEVENWFSSKGVMVVELSYLAQNSLASEAWSHLGYSPFRVFSHKVLENA